MWARRSHAQQHLKQGRANACAKDPPPPPPGAPEDNIRLRADPSGNGLGLPRDPQRCILWSMRICTLSRCLGMRKQRAPLPRSRVAPICGCQRRPTRPPARRPHRIEMNSPTPQPLFRQLCHDGADQANRRMHTSDIPAIAALPTPPRSSKLADALPSLPSHCRRYPFENKPSMATAVGPSSMAKRAQSQARLLWQPT